MFRFNKPSSGSLLSVLRKSCNYKNSQLKYDVVEKIRSCGCILIVSYWCVYSARCRVRLVCV
jgi:hypothetical protein